MAGEGVILGMLFLPALSGAPGRGGPACIPSIWLPVYKGGK